MRYFSLITFLFCAISTLAAAADHKLWISSRSAPAPGAGFSTGGVRARTYRTAQKFCAERGLVMVPVSFDAQGGVLGERPPTADLVFRALRPGDPEIKRPNVEGPIYIQRVQNR